MLLAAGLISSAVTVASRGNPGYALTVVWALVAAAPVPLVVAWLAVAG